MVDEPLRFLSIGNDILKRRGKGITKFNALQRRACGNMFLEPPCISAVSAGKMVRIECGRCNFSHDQAPVLLIILRPEPHKPPACLRIKLEPVLIRKRVQDGDACIDCIGLRNVMISLAHTDRSRTVPPLSKVFHNLRNRRHITTRSPSLRLLVFSDI